MVTKVVASVDGTVSNVTASTTVVMAAPKRGPRGSICWLNVFPQDLDFANGWKAQPSVVADLEATTHGGTKAAVIDDATLGKNLSM
jgi:hypothetical protein